MKVCEMMALAMAWLTFGFATSAVAEDASVRLSGARAAIDASQYATLQAALDALPPEGGIVRIPPGEFEITEPLVIRTRDTLLEGAGSASHVRNVNREGKPALIVTSGRPDPNRKGRLLSLWRVMLTKLRVTGNEASGPGIVARFIDEIHLQSITVSYHGGDGVVLDHCYEDPRVSDCLITYNKGAGLSLLGCHDIVVAANHLEENGDGVRCVEGFNLTMTGNNLDDHLGDNVVLEQMMGSVVSGNMFEEAAGWAVVVDRDTYGVTLSSNVLTNNTTGGIDLRDAHGCTVSANTFSTVPRNSLVIGPNSDRITVAGNTFTNAYLGDGVVKTRAGENGNGSGITLTGTHAINITGNTFAAVQPKALVLKGDPSRQVLFANNTLIDCTGEHDRLVDSVVKDNLEITTGRRSLAGPSRQPLKRSQP
ncbi:MAG: right-handed parallel beta-helix repeat-containing protein [Planctomycetota bacterium]|jgi:parallel beta-helix repeat protein